MLEELVEKGLVSPEEAARPPKQSKFKSRWTVVDGIKFQSKREAGRWQTLRLLERGGYVEHLERQVRFPLVVNGVKVCTYVADFRYFCCVLRKWVVEDAKGFRTRDYRIKSKLLNALEGIEIKEV